MSQTSGRGGKGGGSAYTGAVGALLTLGPIFEEDGTEIEFDYGELGLTEADAAALTKLANDQQLAGEDGDAGWAPMHASIALAEVAPGAAAGVLMKLLPRLEKNGDDVWLELAVELLAGLAKEPGVEKQVCDAFKDARTPFGVRLSLARWFGMVAALYDDKRGMATTTLREVLAWGEFSDAAINESIIAELVEMGDVESLPAIRKAYEKGCVDADLNGTLEDVEKEIRMTPEEREEFYRVELEKAKTDPKHRWHGMVCDGCGHDHEDEGGGEMSRG
jgi:hypothetical protein